MSETSPETKKSVVSPIPEGFSVDTYEKIQKALKQGKPEEQRGLAFRTRRQSNTAFLDKGITKPGRISFDTLRRAAMSVHIVRICIQTLKQKTTKTKWVIQSKDIMKRKSKVTDPRIEELTKFFQTPNTSNESFRTLLDKMTEDLLTLDAVSLEKTRYPDGTLAELYFVDSATIRPVYDEHGNQDIPIPLKTKESAMGDGTEELPVSYVQVMDNSQYGGPESGEVVAAWPQRDMIHFHMNPQGAMEAFGYGLSPIEGILSVVSNILNADNYNSTYFEEGAFPPIILQLIGQVNQRDLEAYREYLMAELSGNFHRPAIMATEKAESIQVHNLKDLTNNDMQFMQYQEWLAKLCCAMFGMSPGDIGITDTQGSKNVAEEQSELSEQKGYSSILHLYKEIFNQEIILKDFGYDDLEFDWVATDQLGPDEASTMYDRDLKNGTRTLNEVRQKIGETPYEDWADEPMILTTDGYKPIDPDKVAEQQKASQEHELDLKGGEKPYEEEADEGGEVTKMRKAVLTYGGFRTWADDRGYSQPFIWMDVKAGLGQVIKPPVAVNLNAPFDMEVQLTNDLAMQGLNVRPVRKMTFIEICEMLRPNPDVYNEFINYTNMTDQYDSEKWRAKFGSSRKFSFYLVSDYIDGYSLSNPLLKADMKRDPESYMEAARDLAALWRMERDMVLGDRRADQYLITHDKRAYGIDYQFMGDVERWEKTKDSIKEALADIPELIAIFDEGLTKSKKGFFERVIKSIRR